MATNKISVTATMNVVTDSLCILSKSQRRIDPVRANLLVGPPSCVQLLLITQSTSILLKRSTTKKYRSLKSHRESMLKHCRSYFQELDNEKT